MRRPKLNEGELRIEDLKPGWALEVVDPNAFPKGALCEIYAIETCDDGRLKAYFEVTSVMPGTTSKDLLNPHNGRDSRYLDRILTNGDFEFVSPESLDKKVWGRRAALENTIDSEREGSLLYTVHYGEGYEHLRNPEPGQKLKIVNGDEFRIGIENRPLNPGEIFEVEHYFRGKQEVLCREVRDDGEVVRIRFPITKMTSARMERLER